jgi:hypothetical protein
MKKDAGAGPENARAEPEVLVHGERGEPDIDPVEEIHRVAEAEKRKETGCRLADGRSRRRILVHPAPPLDSHLARRGG